MNCPRCNAQNDDSRHACWNCFAQLHQAEGVKLVKPPKENRPKKEKVAAPPIPESEPVAPPVMEAVEDTTDLTEQPSDLPVFEIAAASPAADILRDAFESESAVLETSADDSFAVPTIEESDDVASLADSGVPQVEEEEQAGVIPFDPNLLPTDESETQAQEQDIGVPQVLDLSDAADTESGYVVPGLVDLDVSDEAAVQSADQTAEEFQGPGTPESDSQLADKPAEPVSTEETDESEQIEPPPDDTPPSEGGKPRSPLFGLLVIAVILLFGAWMIANSYPSPGSVAQGFVRAVDAVMAGDTQDLSRVSSEDSQADIVRMGEVFEPFRKDRLQLQVSPVEVVSETVRDGTASVVVEVNIGIMGATQAQGPLRVFLVKEGSFARKQWKTDLKVTGEHWQKELPNLLSGNQGIPEARK